MKSIEISKDVFWIGVNYRGNELFEGTWPVPEGVSINSYFIRDEKNVIIDIAKKSMIDEYLYQLENSLGDNNLDYLVINHMEPDHTGLLNAVRKLFPNVVFIVNKKTVPMLEAYYGIQDHLKVVEDGEIIDLGKHKLQFFITPFVHWPETMMTYEVTSKTLFPCDAFGSYRSLDRSIFNDEVTDLDLYLESAKRYYANIINQYSRNVKNALKKLGGLEISMIAPSHGLVWRNDLNKIISLYEKFALSNEGGADPGITIVYGTMYGNTEKALAAVMEGIAQTKVPLKLYNAAHTHPGFILPDLIQNEGVIIGSPTYDSSMFLPVHNVLEAAIKKGVKRHKAMYFGSYGWNGGAYKEFQEKAEKLKWEITESCPFLGAPTDEDLNKLKQIAKQFAESIVNKK